jgi:iron-sulfur cluster assembly protein
VDPSDAIVREKGVTVAVENSALLTVIGTTMDWIETDVESGFKFINPNEKGKCGCGESFHV